MHTVSNPFQDFGLFIRSRAVLPRLILVNVAVWFAIGILRVVSFLFEYKDSGSVNLVVDFLALPASPELFMLRPWTFITYMFLHLDFFHILFNMLWLFWFGKIFLEFLRSRQLLLVYLLGGLSGGLMYVLFYNIFPVFEKSLEQSFALGASASVMAVVTAISVYVPGYLVHLFLLGRVRIIYIAAALFILDFFMIRSSNAGGHIAHIGGALMGLSFTLVRNKGMNFRWLSGDLGRIRLFSVFKKKKKYRHSEKNRDTYSRPLTDEEYNIRRADRQKTVDLILEKIKKSGYGSLSDDEKEFLFKSGDSG
jgi:membrane associated rhomboid family serine protease